MQRLGTTDASDERVIYFKSCIRKIEAHENIKLVRTQTERREEENKRPPIRFDDSEISDVDSDKAAEENEAKRVVRKQFEKDKEARIEQEEAKRIERERLEAEEEEIPFPNTQSDDENERL